MTHLTQQQLRGFQERGGGEERPAILSHLASCEPCRREYAELVRLPAPAATEAPSHLDPRDFVARGRAVYDAANARGFSWRPVWIALPAAAAAALAVVLLRIPGRPLPTALPSASPIEIRGSQLQPLAPLGDVASVNEFRWSSPFAAPRYRVSVKDAAGTTVFSGESVGERLALPAEAAQRLAAGRHTWTVEALDASGRVMSASPARSFTLVR
jgi:hypothetical protein